MSELTVSQQAIAHLQSQIALRDIVRPLVHVCWIAGPADVTRGPQGEVLWECEPPRWLVSLTDDAKLHALAANAPEHRAWLENRIATISSLRFMLAGKFDNPSMSGCSLDVFEGELIVREDTG